MEQSSSSQRMDAAVPVPQERSREPVPVSSAIPDTYTEPGYGDQSEGDRRADLLRYIRVLRKHKWLVGILTVFCFGAGALYSFLTVPIYVSAATIQIDRQAEKVVQVGGVDTLERDDPGFYPTQYELLKSRYLAGRVVAELNLTEDRRFLAATAPSPWGRMRDLVLGAIAKEPNSGSLTVDLASKGTAQPANQPLTQLDATQGDLLAQVAAGWRTVTLSVSHSWSYVRGTAAATLAEDQHRLDKTDFATRQALATSRVLEGLTIQPVGTSHIARISFASPDPVVAAQIANAVSKSFIQTTLDRRYDASSYARNFLQERIQELKLKLEDSEKQLVKYAQDQQIVTIGGGDSGAANGGATPSTSMARAKLSQAAGALAQATQKRLQAEQAWLQSKAANGLMLPESADSKTIGTIRDKRSQLSAEYERGLKDFKPAYPAMLKTKSEMDELDRALKNEIDIVKGSIEQKYKLAQKEESALSGEVESLKRETLDFERRNIQYNILKREVDTNNSLYQGLLQRYKEVGVAGGVGTNNISVVDAAQTPGAPFSPNVKKDLALAFGLGLFLGVLAAFAVEFFDDGLKLAEDVEATLNLPVLGIAPLTRLRLGVAAATSDGRSGLAESFRSLRTALQFSTETGAPKSLVVTSARPSEGKSTVSLALATSFANLGARVLLIDADLRDPSLHRELSNGSVDYRKALGLSNYLSGSATLDEVCHPTKVEKLTFVPAGPLPPNPAELLASPRMPTFLRISEAIYDIIIVDAPPVMGLADAPLLASVAGGTLFVIAANQSRKSAALAALKRLRFARAHILGTVFNKFNHSKAGVSYEYGYDGYYYGGSSEPRRKLFSRKAA